MDWKLVGPTLAVALGVLLSPDLTAQVHVKGYWRKNGTYVAPHYRSSPNGNPYDNYSTRGNYNPYTGKRGTESPSPYGGRSYYQPSATATYDYYVAERARAEAEAARSRLLIEQQRLQAQTQILQMQSELLTSIRNGDRNPKSLSSTELMVLGYGSAGLSFHEQPCTDDCSGHDAGYEWAEDNSITDPDDCDGSSQSFIEGCEAWAEENSD